MVELLWSRAVVVVGVVVLVVCSVDMALDYLITDRLIQLQRLRPALPSRCGFASSRSRAVVA